MNLPVILFFVSLIISGCSTNMSNAHIQMYTDLQNTTQEDNDLLNQKNANQTQKVQALHPFIRKYNKNIRQDLLQTIAHSIVTASEKYKLDYRFLAALIAVESSFNPHAVGSGGSQGLGQLMPGTARSLGVSKPFDPQQNINGMARLLSGYFNKYNNVDKVLAAYKMGSGTVDRYGIRRSSTIAYINKVKGLQGSIL